MLLIIIVLTRIRILKSSSGHVGHWAVYTNIFIIIMLILPLNIKLYINIIYIIMSKISDDLCIAFGRKSTQLQWIYTWNHKELVIYKCSILQCK